MPDAATDAGIDDTPRKLELSTTQIAASALAAVSAAVFASWFGTAGTLVGAALGSIVATVGSATYSYSLNRTAEIARRTALQVKAGGGGLRTGRGRADETAALPTVEAQQDATGETGEPEKVAWWRRLDPRGAALPWGKIALASAAVMVVAMVAITAVEGLAGRSVAQLTGNDESSSTTVGNVFGGSSEPDEEQEPAEPTPSPSEQPTSEPTDDPSAEPTDPATTDPTDVPVPTPTPTEPTTPTPSADPDGTAPGAAGTPSATPSS